MAVANLFESKYGFVDHQVNAGRPIPRVDLPVLTVQELSMALQELPGWQPVESMVPRDYPRPRQELRKVYRFRSFKTAIRFMSDAVETINRFQHHPRWENEWRTVTVYLTTWDIDNRISSLDIQLAKELDSLYRAR